MKAEKREKWRIFTLYLFILTEDLLLFALLFPVSVIVVLDSDSPEEALVNVVALQVFAFVDEEIVRQLLNPSRALGLSFESLVTNHPRAKKVAFYKRRRTVGERKAKENALATTLGRFNVIPSA